MRRFPKFGRREFLVLTASTIGAAATRPRISFGQEDTDPSFVSLKDAHKGTLEIDLRIMNQFGAQPQEVQDFYAAFRVANTGKGPDNAVAAVCEKFERAILGGPMLGDLGTTSIAVWMRLAVPANLIVEVTPVAGGPTKKYNPKIMRRVHSVRCEGLEPDTSYTYRVLGFADSLLGEGSFSTAPTEFSEKPFRIAFGADFHKIGMYRPELMRLIRERGSRAMLLIGDSAVDGRKEDYRMIEVDYMLRNLSPPIQKLTANVPVSATWDDHDYWGNDISGTLTNKNKPISVEGLRRSWKTNWNNPERTIEREGIYFQTHLGPVHYIALDTRSCRVNKDRGKPNCFLGEQQMEWLKQQILESTAEVILISGGTMWSDNISKGKDSWGTWDTEAREQIFSWIDQKKDSLVILMSGDRHGARGFAIPRPDGGKIYELEIGTLGGVPGPEPFGDNREEQLFGIPSRTWAFGELTFTLKNDQLITEFRLINENGEELETLSLKK